jgi:hypothetical protein
MLAAAVRALIDDQQVAGGAAHGDHRRRVGAISFDFAAIANARASAARRIFKQITRRTDDVAQRLGLDLDFAQSFGKVCDP